MLPLPRALADGEWAVGAAGAPAPVAIAARHAVLHRQTWHLDAAVQEFGVASARLHTFGEEAWVFAAFDRPDAQSRSPTRAVGSVLAHGQLHVLSQHPAALHTLLRWHAATGGGGGGGGGGGSGGGGGGGGGAAVAPTRMSYDLDRAMYPVSMGGLYSRGRDGPAMVCVCHNAVLLFAGAPATGDWVCGGELEGRPVC